MLALAVVAAGAVLLTAVGPASSAHKRALATITLDGLPIANGFPLDIGIAQGIFAKHGIEIKKTVFQSGNDIVLAMANHQGDVDWPEYARATESVERAVWLDHLISASHPDQEQLAAAFLSPPLYNRSFSAGFGTLYTAILEPASGRVGYRWPGEAWSFGFDAFEEGERTIRLREREALRFRVPWRGISQ
jgi:hypothetical protein